MKVSLFYEFCLPRPWAADSESALYEGTLAQLQRADELGFHTVWLTEHHYQEEKCHLSSPEVFIGALSQRTSRMRLGHGIVHMPPGINHPVRVAERVATLDVLSAGRIEFGMGEASSEAELDGFNIDPGKKRAMVDEAARIAISALADTPFPGYEGEFVSVPPRNVVPKPIQKPHPPLWLACTRRETVLRAAALGLGALAFQFVRPADAGEIVRGYYNTFENDCVPLGRAVNPNVAMVSFAVCARTEAEAQRRAADHLGFFSFASRHYAVDGVHQPGVTSLWDGFLAGGRQGSVGGSASIGSPDQVRSVLTEFEQTGLDQLSLIVQNGRMTNDMVMESIELIGTEVLPEFIAREEEQSERKNDRMADVVAKVMARAPRAPQAPSDYAFAAPAKAWGSREASTEVLEALRGLDSLDMNGRPG